MEESFEDDDDSNVQDEIKKKNITNKIFMTFYVKFGIITPSGIARYKTPVFGLPMQLSVNVHH